MTRGGIPEPLRSDRQALQVERRAPGPPSLNNKYLLPLKNQRSRRADVVIFVVGSIAGALTELVLFAIFHVKL